MSDSRDSSRDGTIDSVQETLQEQYLRGLEEIEVGQLVDGTVIQVGTEYVFVDIGYKSEGRISLEEFDEPPAVGDTVTVVLVSKESRSGETIVSKKRADERIIWKQVKDAFQNGEPVEGKVSRAVKGGFEVMLGPQIRGFNPVSKMDLRRIENPDEYVGMKSRFYIERLYSENRVNIILSRRHWLEEQVQKERDKFFGSISVGDVVEGTVKSFTSFGSFVDLGGFDGLLHVNDMSWGHVTRPKDVVKRGDVLQLKVVRMDAESQKINLSLKEMTENPWESFTERYQLDDVIRGKVTKLTDFGAFIEIEEGIEGLAHISELSWTKRIKHPSEVVQVGDELEAKILGYDLEEYKVSLGVKQVLQNPWDEIEHKYPEGLRLTRTVKKITQSGAFVELEEGIDGYLHVDDLSWTKRYKNPGAVLTEGEEVEVMVIASDSEERNIRLGVKQLSEDPWQSLRKAYPEGTLIEGEITNVTEFGLFVRVQGGIEGLVPRNHIIDPRESDWEKEQTNYQAGQTVKAVIIELSPARQKLTLSFREIERKEQRATLQQYIHDEDESQTFTLGDFLQNQEEADDSDDPEDA